jgi:hypothetical protein
VKPCIIYSIFISKSGEFIYPIFSFVDPKMKRSHLAIAVSASFLMLTGCTSKQSLPPFTGVKDESASAQTFSPVERFQAARKLAWEAALLVQRPPHSTDTWQEARVKWRQAIRLLEGIPKTAPMAAEAQQKLRMYRNSYAQINQRFVAEQTAADHFERAQTLAWQAAVTVQKPPHAINVWQRASARWAEAISLLEEISPYTSVSAKAQEKLVAYRRDAASIQKRIEIEQVAQATLEKFAQTARHLDTLQSRAITGQSVDALGIRYETYLQLVKSLKQSLATLQQQPEGHQHAAYSDLQVAIADYEFALDIWQTYLELKQANAWWLYDDEFFNQLIPLSKIDGAKLLQRYQVKVYEGPKEAKVPLKFALWEIWEKADQQISLAQKKMAALN